VLAARALVELVSGQIIANTDRIENGRRRMLNR
jgi:hypothetical protein